MKENNILVIGNGFDLYHGLRTRYKDFVEYTKNVNDSTEVNNICKKNPFIRYFQGAVDVNEGWIDCEETIKQIVNILQPIINQAKTKDGFKKSYKSLLGNERCVFNAFESYFSPIDVQVGGGWNISKLYVDKNKSFIERKFITSLESDLNEVIYVLNHYLSKEENHINDIRIRSAQFGGINPGYVINFNYTCTYEKLYKIAPENVLYIHGKINSEPNNIIFGIPDETEEDLSFIRFKKYFQRMQKRTGLINEKFFYATANGRDIPNIVHFFGHSLGITDGDIVKKMNSLSDKMVIYCLDDADYERKLINLIAIFGKGDVQKRYEQGSIVFAKIQ